MSIGSPQLYRTTGRERGLSDETIEAAIAWTAIVERRGYASVLTLRHLAHRTGARYSYLREVVARRRDPYHEFEIRRRGNSSPRLISSPDPILMSVQRWVLSQILSKAPIHDSSYAYQTGKSIRQCAEQHLGARWLIKLDLHNFFHSIDERQVYSAFLRLGYRPLIAFEMTRICTRESKYASFKAASSRWERRHERAIPAYSSTLLGFLPQGAPTSGALANLVTFRMDERITHIAAAHRFVYTRYADDLVLSSTEPFNRTQAQDAIRLIDDAVKQSNLALHEKKTRIVTPGARHIVLGLLVDGDRVRLSKQMRNRIEAHIYGVEKFGLIDHKVARGFSSVLGLARHIDGLLAFAHDIDSDWTMSRRVRWQQSLRHNALALAPASVDDVLVRRYSADYFE